MLGLYFGAICLLTVAILGLLGGLLLGDKHSTTSQPTNLPSWRELRCELLSSLPVARVEVDVRGPVEAGRAANSVEYYKFLA